MLKLYEGMINKKPQLVPCLFILNTKIASLLTLQTNYYKRPLRWKRMVACKRGLGSGPLSLWLNPSPQPSPKGEGDLSTDPCLHKLPD
jgi:hypothetical protein